MTVFAPELAVSDPALGPKCLAGGRRALSCGWPTWADLKRLPARQVCCVAVAAGRFFVEEAISAWLAWGWAGRINLPCCEARTFEALSAPQLLGACTIWRARWLVRGTPGFTAGTLF